MQADNSFYGHAAVLARYARFDDVVPPIWGYLQHGFNLGTGFPSHYRLRGRLPGLVWNDRNAAAATEAGIRAVAVGAPFLYLDRMLSDRRRSVEEAPLGTIAYPYHSWEKNQVDGDHHALAAEIADRSERPVSVCLYWKEWDDPAIRSAYEARVDRVICHGTRYDALFLPRLWLEQSQHRKVVANRMCTALLYGASLGRSVEVFGPTFQVAGDDTDANWGELQRNYWPQVFDGGLPPDLAAEFGRAELGERHLLEPMDLVRTLGWDAPRRFISPLVRLTIDARRRIRGLERPPRPEPLPQDILAAAHSTACL